MVYITYMYTIIYHGIDCMVSIKIVCWLVYYFYIKLLYMIKIDKNGSFTLL
jgi:hypothetical protein